MRSEVPYSLFLVWKLIDRTGPSRFLKIFIKMKFFVAVFFIALCVISQISAATEDGK